MFSVLANNLKVIYVLLLMYAGSFFANVILGLYHNIQNMKEQFSKDKFIKGLIRGGIILVGGSLIVTIISLLPPAVEAFGIQVESGVLEGISVIVIAGVVVSMIVKYIKDAIAKFYAILTIKQDKEV